MKHTIRQTADGTATIYTDVYKEHYHSIHGAQQESAHVFINAGLDYVCKKNALNSQPLSNINIAEMGWGTGLNALLSLSYQQEKAIPQAINYTGIEAHPLDWSLVQQTDYAQQAETLALFKAMHQCTWNKPCPITAAFTLLKVQIKLQNFTPQANSYHLIYFDAFAPNSQPQLWTRAIFEQLFTWLTPNGVLTTYCAKGQVKRNMKAAGFIVEALPGPPGKREMTRAIKPNRLG